MYSSPLQAITQKDNRNLKYRRRYRLKSTENKKNIILIVFLLKLTNLFQNLNEKEIQICFYHCKSMNLIFT